MFLQSIKVENYRAVKKGQLTFDKSIAVIGENDSGKSSILDALAKMLCVHHSEYIFKPEKRHFYHDTVDESTYSQIRIDVEFIERTPGEWKNEAHSILKPLLTHLNNVKNKLQLCFRANYSPEHKAETSVYIVNPITKRKSEDISLVNWLQRMNPVIHLSAGQLTGRGLDKLKSSQQVNPENTFPEHLQKQVDVVKRSAGNILSGNSINLLHEVEQGYKSALQLNKYLSEINRRSVNSLNIEQIRNSKNSLPKTVNNSEKLGTLLVINALVDACRSTNLTDVDPIWIIEDPEAHLHKMTLASVTNVIRGISGQKVITTNSGGFLANVPLHQVRRLQRHKGIITEYYMQKNSLPHDDIRRINYHVRTHRNNAFFSRVWLLVEGETEFWILPRLARVLGYDFRLEGITCVEYAQSGLRPLLRIAEKLNIQWLMLSDGDKAGHKYANQARNFIGGRGEGKICVFPAHDIEQYFWDNGFKEVYIKLSRTRVPHERINPARTIKSAIRNYSKPHLALSIVDAAEGDRGIPVPEELVKLIENCVRIARGMP